MTLPSQTRVRIAALDHRVLNGPVSRAIDLMSGRSQYDVVPLRSPRDRFEVRTPTDAPMWAWIALALALAAIWMALFGCIRLRPGPATRFGLGVGALVLLATILALKLAYLWLPPAAALIALIVVQPLWSWRRLSAVSEHMLGELSRLAADPDLTTRVRRPRRLGENRVSDQIALLSYTIARPHAAQPCQHGGAQPARSNAAGRPRRRDRARQRRGARCSRPRSRDRRPIWCSPTSIARLPVAIRPTALFRAVARRSRAPLDRRARRRRWQRARNPPCAVDGRSGRVARRDRALRRHRRAPPRRTAPRGGAATHAPHAQPAASILALLAHHHDPIPPAFNARVRHYAERTIDLAGGFLQLARAEAGSYARVPVDLADVLVEAVDDLWPGCNGERHHHRNTRHGRGVFNDRRPLAADPRWST